MEDQGTILSKLSVILPELAVAGEGDKHRGELKRRGRNQSKRWTWNVLASRAPLLNIAKMEIVLKIAGILTS